MCVCMYVCMYVCVCIYTYIIEIIIYSFNLHEKQHFSLIGFFFSCPYFLQCLVAQ